MAINLLRDKGTPLSQQRMSWKDMVGKPISKLDDDAFTRVRVILMNGLELDSLRTKQVALRILTLLNEHQLESAPSQGAAITGAA